MARSTRNAATAALVALLGLVVAGCGQARAELVAYGGAEEFDAAVGALKPGQGVFVKWYAPWCGHCKRLAPTWKRLAADVEAQGRDGTTIAHVDCTTDGGKELCAREGVSGYPTLKLYEGGAAETPYKGERSLLALKTFLASASLYVGDLLPDVTEALLFDIFNAVGPVASVRVCRDAATRRSLGYGYVNFHRAEDAERALDTMNFASIRGQACRIMWSHRDPSLRRSGAGNVFVKNLDEEIDNKTLYDTFSMFGNILSCKVATSRDGKSLGYGFVHYESEESANAAIEQVNGMEIAGHTVEVARFKSKQERGGDSKDSFTNVFVKNLPEDWSADNVREIFAPHGEVTSIHVALTDEKKSRGFGFVNFAEPAAAAAAVEALNGHEAAPEKKLYVGRAQPKAEREKELRQRFEQAKLERQKKYAGVNLYVKNLAETVDKDKLIEEFSQYGAITSARVMSDDAGKSKGFGFVCFSTPEEATKAVTELNGKMFEGKPLYVALAQRKEQRRAQLEAQHAARTMVPPVYAGQPHMYPGPPQLAMYPPQAGGPAGPWNPAMPMPPMMAYGAVAQGQQPGQQQQQQGGAFKYTNQARNMQQPQQQQQQRQPQQQQQQAPQQPEPLTTQALAAAPEGQQKRMIGERLFPLIMQRQPESAGKITGMLLEMDNGELLHLLESSEALDDKVREAVEVLRAHQATA